MQWWPFRYNQKTYDLSHLHPHSLVYTQSAQGDKPEQRFKVNVKYSMHCFTREEKAGENAEPALSYSDNWEGRIFDFHRWELSHRLPDIVQHLMGGKCYHAGRGNFLIIELVKSESGETAKYEVFFEVSRSNQKGVLNLFIQSAYVRTTSGNPRSGNKPVGFSIILRNTLSRIEIKAPK